MFGWRLIRESRLIQMERAIKEQETKLETLREMLMDLQVENKQLRQRAMLGQDNLPH